MMGEKIARVCEFDMSFKSNVCLTCMYYVYVGLYF
jgi:hypothetical protein